MAKDPNAPSLPFDDGTLEGTDPDTTYFVLASNWSIGPLLARGCLLPPAVSDRTEIAWFDDYHGHELLLSARGFPEAWNEAVRNGGRNTYPIGIRLRQRPDWLDSSSSTPSDQAVLLGDVDGLVFDETKEMKQFSSMAFADFDVASLGLVLSVEAEVFRHSDPAPMIRNDRVSTTEDSHSAARLELRKADSDSAITAALLAAAPGTPGWIDATLRSTREVESADGLESGWVGSMRRGISLDHSEQSETSLEMALLAAASHVLSRKYGLNEGWPASEVLAEIESETARRCNEQALQAEGAVFETWGARCREILAARVEPQPLRDDRWVVLRAVLLVLLRGEVEPILETPTNGSSHAALEVGPRVKTVAACLASIRYGLRSLPSSMKIIEGPRHPWIWTDFLGRSFLAALSGERDNRERGAPRLEAEYRSIGLFQGEWVLAEAGEELLRRSRVVDPGLQRLAAMGRELGYDLEEFGESGLKLALRWEDGRGQPVHISLRRADDGTSAVVRFWSPALDVAIKRGKKKWPTPALNKKPKGFFLDLLERNASPHLNCRFAISEEEEAVIVLVDQLLSTLDDQEFKQRVEHVARVADGFEKERGVDEFR